MQSEIKFGSGCTTQDKSFIDGVAVWDEVLGAVQVGGATIYC